MKVKDWIEILRGLDPEEVIIGALWTRDLFGDEMLRSADGETEYAECPKHIWDTVADRYEFRDHANEDIYEDIRMDLQDAIERHAHATEAECALCHKRDTEDEIQNMICSDCFAQLPEGEWVTGYPKGGE